MMLCHRVQELKVKWNEHLANSVAHEVSKLFR